MDRRIAQEWLFSLERFGMKLGLDAVRVLLAELGWPGRGLPTVIVAGTNGKGSTAAMTAAILTRSGARTMLYTSPHVSSVRERIAIGGRPISSVALESCLDTVRRTIRSLRRRRCLPHHPTFFEVLTAAALLHAQRRHATALVLEVGLGGCHDATNVMAAQVAIITSISADHQRQLGTSLARIAWNKAGVIKDGATVLTAVTHGGALRTIEKAARRHDVRLRRVPSGAARRLEDGRWDLSLDGGRWAAGLNLPPTLRGVRLGLAGAAQGMNAVLATAASAALLPLAGHRHPSRRTLRIGLGAARLPGRHEVRRARGDRRVLLDAAHNPAACATLATELRVALGHRSMTLVFGVMRDKDAAAMLAALVPPATRVILCRPGHSRARAPGSLRTLLPRGVATHLVPDPDDAWDQALRITPPGDVILVTGSFYLLGDLAQRTARLPRAEL